jgi:crotonobetainyl-CoA:carnitine CoA-transferase CaiB-like acyl-CoA transferase
MVDPRLKTNNDRVMAREWMMPILRTHLADRSAAELSAVFEASELPFAPITRPEALFDDPHLNANGGLAPIRMNDGSMSKAPLLPFTMGGKRAGIRLQPPLLGEHTDALLTEVGYSDEEIAALKDRNIATGN